MGCSTEPSATRQPWPTARQSPRWVPRETPFGFALAEALNSESSFGVWGGLTERERRALLRRFPEVDDWGLWLEREDDELVAEIHARRAPRILARVRCAS